MTAELSFPCATYVNLTNEIIFLQFELTSKVYPSRRPEAHKKDGNEDAGAPFPMKPKPPLNPNVGICRGTR